jgi:hypothetical protein
MTIRILREGYPKGRSTGKNARKGGVIYRNNHCSANEIGVVGVTDLRT